ncbi:unnamed protein product [Fusarium graminearum]|nr:unnamed protein product [Fusarium graminearum]VTO88594.1 unnamed protein product [Fusarium graminearum]
MTFLDITRTLTAHLHRLIRSSRPCEVALCPPRILNLNPPRHTLQCFINSTQVEANADTGAEIDLASPEFAARSEFSIEPTDQQHQFVQLADGSIASISGCFRARFNPSEKPSTETLRPRAHMKTFHILDGLTSDILLSRHQIFEIYAFVEQANAFSEMERPDLHADLHLIAWLNRWRSKSGSRPIQYTSS